MKSVTRRKQQQEDLRAKILDAARELFVNEGVEAVSMRKVADKIGYSATTLYNYFDDKEALLFALCDADFGTLQELFKKIGKIADPIERLRKLGQAYITFALAISQPLSAHVYDSPCPSRRRRVPRDRARRSRPGFLCVRQGDRGRGTRGGLFPQGISRP